MTVGRLLWCCALAISLFNVSNALNCHATCLMFGVRETAFTFRQRIVSDDDDAVPEDPSLAYNLLSLHNAVRQDLAAGSYTWPPASNMRLMEWDQELETLAYESLALWLSTTCTLSPPECFWTTPNKNFAINYAMAGGPGRAPGINEMLYSWTHFNSSITLENPTFWSSFSNVMAANSFRLGCSQTVLVERGLHARFLLCYYDPGSNNSQIDDVFFNISLLYKPGGPCTECPVGTACNASSIYPALCAVDDTLTSEGIQNSPNIIFQHSLSVVLMVTSCYLT